jgi:hypothetical protein
MAMHTSEFVPSRRDLAHVICERCGSIMLLTKIEPDKPDYDRRTFDCIECNDTVVEIVKYR